MLATHLDAEKRYDAIRRATLRVAMQYLPPTPGLELRLIDPIALTITKDWAATGQRKVDWDWFAGYNDLQYRYPKRFELAIWHHGVLVNVTFGRPTYHGAGLRLDFIEASPEKQRIRVVPIVVVAATAYAEAIGASEVRIMKPINEDVKAYYARLGFTYVSKGDYLFKKIWRNA